MKKIFSVTAAVILCLVCSSCKDSSNANTAEEIIIDDIETEISTVSETEIPPADDFTETVSETELTSDTEAESDTEPTSTSETIR